MKFHLWGRSLYIFTFHRHNKVTKLLRTQPKISNIRISLLNHQINANQKMHTKHEINAENLWSRKDYNVYVGHEFQVCVHVNINVELNKAIHIRNVNKEWHRAVCYINISINTVQICPLVYRFYIYLSKIARIALKSVSRPLLP